MITKIYAHTIIRFVKFFSRKNMKNYMYQAIEKHTKKNQVIYNVGSGGIIAHYLKSKNISFTEVDIDPERKPDIVMSMEDMSNIKDNSVDVIFCMEVLEHVKNPHLAVAEAHRVLKKNGVFVGSTPFVFPIHDAPYDFYRYTKYGLQHLFRNFTQLQLKERNSYMQAVFVVLIRTLNTGTIAQRCVGLLLLPFFIVLLPLFILFSWLVTNTEATTGYFFVFKK